MNSQDTNSPSTDLQEKESLRPGISDLWLQESRIRHIRSTESEPLIGEKASGLLIPYYDLEGNPILEQGKHFCRLRYDNPPSRDKKYHQVTGSRPHVYVPGAPGSMVRTAKDIKQIEILHLIEGEFKALALWERGHFALGLNGIWGFSGGKDTLHQELQDAISWLKPKEIWFHGDADTIWKPDFARAACRLAELIDEPINCPRLDPNGPKGIDDVYQQDPNFDILMAPEITVTADQKPLWALQDLILNTTYGLSFSDTALKSKIQKALASFHRDPAFESTHLAVSEAFAAKKTPWVKEMTRYAAEAKNKSKKAKEEKEKEVSPELEAQAKRIYQVGEKYIWCLPEDSGVRELPLLTVSQLRNHMTLSGFPKEFQREVEMQAELFRKVDFAGKINGRPQGYHEDHGSSFVCTESPHFIKGIPNQEDFFKMPQTQFLNRFFLYCTPALTSFISWLKIARLAITDYRGHHPGQALIFVGDAGTGKSLTQTFITHCLGGRGCATAAAYIQGDSRFNEELWRCEHIILDDISGDTRQAIMRRATDRLKNLIASPVSNIEGKGKPAATLRPIWRITISSNANTESKSALPVLDGSTKDKISVFSVGAAADYKTLVTQGKSILRDVLLPGIEQWLYHVDEWEIPESIQCPRYGVLAYHDDEISEGLHEDSDAFQFQELLQSYFGSGNKTLEDNSTGILRELLLHFPESRNFLRNSSRTGGLLRQLKAEYDQCVKYDLENSTGLVIQFTRNKSKRLWKITPEE